MKLLFWVACGLTASTLNQEYTL